MTDALTLIRQYTIGKKLIESRDGLVFLGDFCWDIKSETNYMVYGTGRDGQPKEFYSIETILFFLENADKLSHPHYVKVSHYNKFKILNYIKAALQKFGSERDKNYSIFRADRKGKSLVKTHTLKPVKICCHTCVAK